MVLKMFQIRSNWMMNWARTKKKIYRCENKDQRPIHKIKISSSLGVSIHGP